MSCNAFCYLTNIVRIKEGEKKEERSKGIFAPRCQVAIRYEAPNLGPTVTKAFSLGQLQSVPTDMEETNKSSLQ